MFQGGEEKRRGDGMKIVSITNQEIQRILMKSKNAWFVLSRYSPVYC